MREIKFRAWDIERKLMINSCYNFISFSGQPLISSVDSNRYIVMQFTGLHDNTKWQELTEDERAGRIRLGNMPFQWKGKEIYEDDIVEFRRKIDPVVTGKIIYENAAFWIDIKGHDLLLLGENNQWCKLIGDIHQNPELLKD